MRFCRKSRLMIPFLIFVGGLLLVINTTLYLNASKDVRNVHVRHREPFPWSTVTHRQAIATVQNDSVNTATKKSVAVRKGLDSKPLPVLITVKTGLTYHRTRIPLLLQTWFNYAPNEVSSRSYTDGSVSRVDTGISDFDRRTL